MSKEEIKYVSKLLLKKFRQKEGKFIAEGKRLINEAIESNFICEQVIVTELFSKNEKDLIKYIIDKKIKVSVIGAKDFQKISSTKNSQCIAGIFKISKPKIEYDKEKFIVALENISDPGNLGTILRSCDWFGIKSVILSNDCAELYNPKVVRASMGAVFNIKIVENIDLIGEIHELKNNGFTINVADMNGIDYTQADWNRKSLIVFCNEANGPTKELINLCDTKITIPKKGKIDSLNVSAAAAVILSQIKS